MQRESAKRMQRGVCLLANVVFQEKFILEQKIMPVLIYMISSIAYFFFIIQRMAELSSSLQRGVNLFNYDIVKE